MKKQQVFLDTSIQIQRVLSEPEERERLNAIITAPTIQAITSSYVWMEFQRAVVADFAYVHQLMQQYSDWGSLFSHILDGERAFRPRSAVRCTQIVGNLYTTSGHHWETAQYALAEQIQNRLQKRFWMGVVAITDSIICDLVTKGITQKADQTYAVPASCRKESAACQLPAFLATHQARLHTLATYLTDHSHAIKDQDRFARLLTAILAEPRAALGQTSCWPLGDLIIALQVPADTLLWTLDADFAPLAEALEIALYRPETSSSSTSNTL